MNREQKRDFIKKARAKGISEEYAKAYISMLDSKGKVNSPIREGTKIYLDVEKIKAGKNYSRMNPEYKEFVEASIGVTYTAHIEDEGCLISVQENPKWLFWVGDVIEV